MSKYNNVKCKYDGRTFDSIAEAERYILLKDAVRRGIISGLEMQVPFEIVPADTGADGKKLRALKYVADFTYYDMHGHLHVEDVKGVRTAVYKLKKRLMWHIYRIDIEEI